MHLIASFVSNPVKVTVGVLLISLFGVVALERMPMQLTPEVQTPTITVEVVADDGLPVNGSDAVFAAVAAATWCHRGCPPELPTG